MANVAKFISTRSFFQLGAELKREKYDHGNDNNPQLWLAFIISFVFFIWAVYSLIKYWRDLPAWVVIVGILLLFMPVGPLLTLLLVYYTLGALGGNPRDLHEGHTHYASGPDGKPHPHAGPRLLGRRPAPNKTRDLETAALKSQGGRRRKKRGCLLHQ